MTDEVKEKDKNKKKIGYKIHLIIASIMVIVVIVGIVRLIIWNGRNSVVIPKGDDEADYSGEVMDYYSYSESRRDAPIEGTKKAVILGNYMVNNAGSEYSVISRMREELTDWDLTDLSVELSMVASEKHENEGFGPRDPFCLFNMAKLLCKKNEDIKYSNSAFAGKDTWQNFLERAKKVDLNDTDVLIIMYAYLDYFNAVVPWYEEEHFITTYYGSMTRAIDMFQETYPDLEIIIASGYPMYFTDSDGNMMMGYTADFGRGNLSAYYSMEFNIVSKYCLSFIDNYYYGIDEENITQYVDKQNLTDAGIDLVGGHIASYLKKYIK